MSQKDVRAGKAGPQGESGRKSGAGEPLDPGGHESGQHISPGAPDPDELLNALRSDGGAGGSSAAKHNPATIAIKPASGAGTIKPRPGVSSARPGASTPKPGGDHSGAKPPHGTSKPPRAGGSGGGGRSKVPGS
jgi:hypothetical protein